MNIKELILNTLNKIAIDKNIDKDQFSSMDIYFELSKVIDENIKDNVINWVAIKDEMPPVNKYVLLVKEDHYMSIEFIDEYSLTTNKYPKNFTHWAYQPKSPNL